MQAPCFVSNAKRCEARKHRRKGNNMTLYEALQDAGKGRIVDTGCDYKLIALAKGRYTFTTFTGYTFTLEATGSPAENARQIERQFYAESTKNRFLYNEIKRMDYKKF